MGDATYARVWIHELTLAAGQRVFAARGRRGLVDARVNWRESGRCWATLWVCGEDGMPDEGICCVDGDTAWSARVALAREMCRRYPHVGLSDLADAVARMDAAGTGG